MHSPTKSRSLNPQVTELPFTILLPAAASAFIKVRMEQRSYAVGENIDHITDAAARVRATSRGKCLRRRHDGEGKKTVFFLLLFLCSAGIHFCVQVQDLFKVHTSLFYEIMLAGFL